MLSPSVRRNGITYTHNSYLCLIQVHRKKSKHFFKQRDTNVGQLVTFNTVSKRYQGTGIFKSDCKQPLRIGIIRALNECTGRLFRATKRHNHKSSDMQSKKISNDQELIQSDPISCPQNQKGNN